MNPVWQAIATFLLRKRIYILIVLGLLTAFMFSVRQTEMSQVMYHSVPDSDIELIKYQNFKQEFGEDGNVMGIGIEGDIFTLENFNGLYDLTANLQTVYGVERVLSITHLYTIRTLFEDESFEVGRLVPQKPTTQAELDSLTAIIDSLPFYQGLLLDESHEFTLLAVTITDTILNSAQKTDVYDDILAYTEPLAASNSLSMRYAGLPVLRANNTKTLNVEITLFLGISLIVLAITLLFFFRSAYNVIFPMLVVGVVIIWSMGFLGLFNYELDIVTAIIPALITVISIPNCVYLITKYHIEYRHTRNKIKALILVIERIGIVTIMTNATTAVGLGVLAFTDIKPLERFGIVASLSVISAFVISLVLIPIMFSFLPPPTTNQTRHLDRRTLSFGINLIDRIVHRHRWGVYIASAIIAGIAIYGMTLVVPVSYVMDDVPRKSQVLSDINYLEERFNGVLPFEILVDTKRKQGVQRLSNLERIHELQEKLKSYDQISRTVSAADFAMFLRQAFFGGNPLAYDIPSRSEYRLIRSFLLNTDLNTNSLSKSLTDSTFQKTRISATVKDIGSIEMEILLDSMRKDIDEIFDPEDFEVSITGATPLFVRGNQFLIENLITSLLIAFGVIAIIMGILFRSVRMVLISIIPNLLPLIMVAGIMGFTGIPLKPSTALVFGVAFGIAVDDSIHYLARYRMAKKMGDSVKAAVSNSFKDTGVSMIYTSIILFLGFITFTGSSFGGTQSLGLLTSLTLGIAMFSNLILLPVLLLSFDKDTPVPAKL